MQHVVEGNTRVNAGPRVLPEYWERDAPSNAVEWATTLGLAAAAIAATVWIARRVLR